MRVKDTAVRFETGLKVIYYRFSNLVIDCLSKFVKLFG